MELITTSSKYKFFPESTFIERLGVLQQDSIAGSDVRNVERKGVSDDYFLTKNPGHLRNVFDFQELGYLLT